MGDLMTALGGWALLDGAQEKWMPRHSWPYDSWHYGELPMVCWSSRRRSCACTSWHHSEQLFAFCAGGDMICMLHGLL
jgi:hypothetical protein